MVWKPGELGTETFIGTPKTTGRLFFRSVNLEHLTRGRGDVGHDRTGSLLESRLDQATSTALSASYLQSRCSTN